MTSTERLLGKLKSQWSLQWRDFYNKHSSSSQMPKLLSFHSNDSHDFVMKHKYGIILSHSLSYQQHSRISMIQDSFVHPCIGLPKKAPVQLVIITQRTIQQQSLMRKHHLWESPVQDNWSHNCQGRYIIQRQDSCRKIREYHSNLGWLSKKINFKIITSIHWIIITMSGMKFQLTWLS